MKKHLLIIACAALTFSATAQQDPQFTQWMFDRISFNPAAAGIDRMHCISFFHRDQWDGFDRDPKTYLLNYNGYVQPKGKLIGVGATFFTEVLGQEQNTIFRASGAYHHQMGENTLSVGLQLGMVSKKIGANWIYIDPDDSAIPENQISQGGFDASLGVMFYSGTKFYAGASATHLPAAELDKLNVKMARHYYFMGGYNHDLNSDIVLRGNLLLKSDFAAKPAFDLNVNALWQDMVWGGLSFRPGDAIAPMAGFQKTFAPKQSGRTTLNSKFMIGYSYDVTTSEIKDYSAGSHEIFLTYCFNLSQIPLRARHGDPRFL